LRVDFQGLLEIANAGTWLGGSSQDQPGLLAVPLQGRGKLRLVARFNLIAALQGRVSLFQGYAGWIGFDEHQCTSYPLLSPYFTSAGFTFGMAFLWGSFMDIYAR
jgi:hypothetical protein